MIEKRFCRPCDSLWEDDTEDETYQQMVFCPYCGGRFDHGLFSNKPGVVH